MEDKLLFTERLKVGRESFQKLQRTSLVRLADQVSKEACDALLREVKELAIPDPNPELRHGPRKIREEVSYQPVEGIVALVAQAYALYFRNVCSEAVLDLNECAIWRFPEWSIGIEPHFEFSRIANLQVQICLKGGITYHLHEPDISCQVRAGDVLMRAYPGFGEAYRRMHSVSSVRGETIVLSLREHIREGDSHVHT